MDLSTIYLFNKIENDRIMSFNVILTTVAVFAVIISANPAGFGVGASPILVPLCETGYFYNISNRLCTICSQCPLNQIIQQPCIASDDTLCGPFYEFEFFNKANANKNQNNNNGDKEKDKDTLAKELNLFKIESSQTSTQQNRKTSFTKEIEERRDGPSVHNAANKWKELSYGLIAALVILAVVFTVYVIVAQMQLAKLHKQVKTASVEGGKEDENIYCYSALQAPVKSVNNPRLSTTDMNRHRLLHPIYRPGQARRLNNTNINNINNPIAASQRAAPNEYVIQNGCQLLQSSDQKEGSSLLLLNQKQEIGQSASSSRLLPVIPESSTGEDCDHVRVLYTT